MKFAVQLRLSKYRSIEGDCRSFDQLNVTLGSGPQCALNMLTRSTSHLDPQNPSNYWMGSTQSLSAGQSVSQSVGQSVSQSVNQSVSQSDVVSQSLSTNRFSRVERGVIHIGVFILYSDFFVCLWAVCLSVCLSVCLYVCLSVCLVCLCLCPSVCRSVSQ